MNPIKTNTGRYWRVFVCVLLVSGAGMCQSSADKSDIKASPDLLRQIERLIAMEQMAVTKHDVKMYTLLFAPELDAILREEHKNIEKYFRSPIIPLGIEHVKSASDHEIKEYLSSNVRAKLKDAGENGAARFLIVTFRMENNGIYKAVLMLRDGTIHKVQN